MSEAGGKVFPAVVYIQVVTGNLKSGRAQNDVVSGSGVLITPDGELLSNWHVVDKAQSIRCLLNDGRAFTAKVVGLDKDLDLSLLKLDLPEGTPPLPHAAIDYEDRLTEGDFVMAMGAPWGAQPFGFDRHRFVRLALSAGGNLQPLVSDRRFDLARQFRRSAGQHRRKGGRASTRSAC